MKTTCVKLNSAIISIDNSNDEQRTYNVKSEVEISENEARRFMNGEVTNSDQKRIATFNKQGSEISMRFIEVLPDEQININRAINEYIDSAKNVVTTSQFFN